MPQMPNTTKLMPVAKSRQPGLPSDKVGQAGWHRPPHVWCGPDHAIDGVVPRSLKGATKVAETATCQEMTGDPDDVNSIEEPQKLAPKTNQISASPVFTHELPAHSVSVIKLNAR